MSSDCEDSVQYIPYKEIVKQKSKEYYNKNKETIKQKAREYYYKNEEKVQARQKDKYDLLPPEEKKKRYEYDKEWFEKQPIEKLQELIEKAKQYHTNRYHNLMIAVNQSNIVAI